MDFKQISVQDAKEKISQQGTILIDIRDPDSYQTSHINEAFHLTNENIQEFIQNADLGKPVIVYCYHGNSSQSAAQFLSEQGFEEVYSMMGGFAAWQQQG